ncbi:transcription factor iws1 [Hymenopellis radicata]|nr:transcription factor iws1 [Hymenopellis radicata]
MASKEILERDIFGGSDSELSSDENEERPAQQKAAYPSSGDESDEDYAREKPTKKGRPQPQKIIRGQDIDLSTLPPDQASKIRVERQIEAILKPKKSNRPKKRKNNEEVLDSFADDQVARLREAMNNAVEEDKASKADGLPATAKLRLLPEVMETLRKASLAQSIIDNNLLEAVRLWLEPLPDHSLPSLNIQREFFQILPKMEFIDSSVLKESGLGKIVMFYTKCKRITPDISRIAEDLVATWSRPIIKRSASYRDRVIPLSEGAFDTNTTGEKLHSILARAKEQEKFRVRKNAVMVPQRDLGNFTVAPRSNLRPNSTIDGDSERRRNNNARLKSLKSRLSNNK